jgi:lipoprotein NlpD
VQVAADGLVVYAGDSLPGYGELLIVKHDDTWLTAYGHNSALLVGEGARVRRGDTIARLGLGPGRRPLLHFEIRRNGDPVDPLAVLPPR